MKHLIYCWFVFCLTFGIGINCFESKAQVSEKGLPESFLIEQKQAVIIPVLKLDSVRFGKMLEEDKKFRIDNRYGVVKTCEINIKESGISTEIRG
ncbi:MAG: hypothetical protein Q8T04_21270, partial [Bacteroidota bacterium]|nr:hypothetical protein [Bacteroidota bacterium]